MVCKKKEVIVVDVSMTKTLDSPVKGDHFSSSHTLLIRPTERMG